MSNLEDLYREVILDHYRSPRNRGELETPPAVRVEGFNPLCGDEIVVYLAGQRRHAHRHQADRHGCSISQSSSSLMSAAVKGKPLDQVRDTIVKFKQLMTVHESSLETTSDPEVLDVRALGELAALQGVVKFPVRIKCAVLAWNTLSQALDEVSA